MIRDPVRDRHRTSRARPGPSVARRRSAVAAPAALTAAAVLAVAAAFALPRTALGQEPAQELEPQFELTVENIMRGPELVGDGPSQVEWTDDGSWIYFRWKPGGEDWDEDSHLYRVPADGDAPERLSDVEADSLGVLLASGDLSPDEDRRVLSYQGDLYLRDTGTLEVTRLTDTEAREGDPVFGADGEGVYYVQDDELFRLDLENGSIHQLTDIRQGPEPEEEEPEGREAFLEEQQRELFDHIRREAEEEEEREALQDSLEAGEPETVWIGPNEQVFGLEVSPAGGFAILEVGSPAADAQRTLVPDYVTETGYTEPREVRAKVGDAQGEGRMGLVELATGEITWLDLVPETEGSDDDAEQAAGDDRQEEEGEDRRLASTSFIGWNADGSVGLVGAVSFDFKDQWLWALDAATGEMTLLAHDHDEAWIGGPCDPWLSPSCAGWLPDGETVYFVSERSGWSQLYTVSAAGGEPQRITRGEWEVHGVDVSADEEGFEMTASRASPFVRHFYRMEFDGSGMTRVTEGPGRHDVEVSPDGELLWDVHSTANRPPELFVQENRPGAEARRITVSPTEAWSQGPWIEPEIVHFEARDGTSVPARIYRPEDLGAEPNGAGVIFVHGAGYLHNVHRWWSTYYREYMFHHILASRGYTVLDIDYRGSAGYGRDWRTAIYRHMGGQDLTDQVDGARLLLEQEGVEPGRIGIYGGSYGGFITLMALFKHPEDFGAGAALRSVTDWAHYNHWYTSRILNLPQDDEEAYRQSSPIYFAEGLEDPLLIAHGMVDTNVHFQDVVRLAQRLIELGKEDWEMAVYPVEGHGFDEPSSWTDEYSRILKIFEENLR